MDNNSQRRLIIVIILVVAVQAIGLALIGFLAATGRHFYLSAFIFLLQLPFSANWLWKYEKSGRRSQLVAGLVLAAF